MTYPRCLCCAMDESLRTGLRVDTEAVHPHNPPGAIGFLPARMLSCSTDISEGRIWDGTAAVASGGCALWHGKLRSARCRHGLESAPPRLRALGALCH